MSDPLKPSTTLLVKLGSAAVHAEEYLSPDGAHADKIAFLNCLGDPEVQEWIDAMNTHALLPLKRNG